MREAVRRSTGGHQGGHQQVIREFIRRSSGRSSGCHQGGHQEVIRISSRGQQETIRMVIRRS
jgi:hypothetical protein